MASFAPSVFLLPAVRIANRSESLHRCLRFPYVLNAAAKSRITVTGCTTEQSGGIISTSSFQSSGSGQSEARLLTKTMPDAAVGTQPVGRTDVHVCFESAVNDRYRRRADGWTTWQCMCDCIISAHYVPSAAGRLMQHVVPDLPLPQSMITNSRIAATNIFFVLDVRSLDMPLTVLDAALAGTILETRVPLYHANIPRNFLLDLAAGNYPIFVNHQPAQPHDLLPPDIDALTIIRPTCPGSLEQQPLALQDFCLSAVLRTSDRPPTPPVPGNRWNRRFQLAEVPQEVMSDRASASPTHSSSAWTVITVYDSGYSSARKH